MGARLIKRIRIHEAVRAHQNIKRRARLDPRKVTVCVLQDELTKEIKSVAIDREVAAKLREKNSWHTVELIDFMIEV